MRNTQTITSEQADTAIEKLLAAEPVSIVDGLFELTGGDPDGVPDGWHRAVIGRLQTRLVNRIRFEIGRRPPESILADRH